MQVADEHANVRLAVALAHCLPECRVELEGDDGSCVLVGFCREAGLTPCAAYRAVAVARRLQEPRLADLLGLPAGCCIRARVGGRGVEESHAGLGVYRYENGAAYGHVFATTLDASDARQVVLRCSAARVVSSDDDERRLVRAGRWFFVADDLIAVTLCFSELPATARDLTEPAEALALEIAGACVVDEVVGG